MHFKVTHTTRYEYDRPIFFEPHTFRLQPRSDATQRLQSYSLELTPNPTGRTEQLDAEGNSTTRAWFDGTHSEMVIVSRFEVETLRSNPFDYLPESRGEQLPVRYLPEHGEVLNAYQARMHPAAAVKGFADAVAHEAENDTLKFLNLLMQKLFDQTRIVIREEGEPEPSLVTLDTREGSCRDISVLFVDCCRSQGLAARFVSGYQEGDAGQEKRYMHAWAEAYVPGGGWRGYDPTLGLAVSDRHIVVATGAESAAAAPFEGNFRGTGARSVMQADIQLEMRDP